MFIFSPKVSQTTPHHHAQLVSTVLMPQTTQFHVQMEPTETPLERVTYQTVISALLAITVRCLTVVSGDMSVQMALFVLLEELLQQFAWLVISVIKPKLNCHAPQGHTALRALLHQYPVLRDTIVIL